MSSSNCKNSFKNTNMGVAQRKADTQSAKIRFSTQIIRRLGEELNPSIDQSILELVKNAYDADATSCIVELDNIKGTGGTIKISDNGIGMDDQAIINGWLVLGESSKSINKRTKFGRIPAGSKGLGRLAALRMGSIATLESIPSKDTASKYELILDWPKFDKVKLVDQILIPIVKRPAPQKSNQGTTIYLKNLANKIGEREVKRLARGLILLADPFDDDPHSFKPRLIADEFREMEKLVSQRYFDDADYHLQANVNSKGFGTASILDYKGNVLFKAKHADLSEKSRSGRIYDTPPVSFDLWAFLLIQTTFSTRPTSLGEVKDWLNEFGGVHLYENGLRVNPYGNPGNDWLDLNLARSRNPEERPSTNTSIGIVRVKDSKGLLSQKTDRSGFIENDVFHEIKSFCHDALEWMARERLKVAEVKRRAARARAEKDSGTSSTEVAKSIAKLPPAKRTVVQKAFDKYEKSHQQEIKTLKSEIQLYRTLSTAGITAATFSHESSGNPIKVISNSIKTIDRRIKEHAIKHHAESFEKPIERIKKSIDSLAVLGNATLKLLQHEKRRMVKIELHRVIREVIEIFEPFFEGRDIEVIENFASNAPYLRTSQAAIESIVTNLFNNSITALESVLRERKIYISTEIIEDTFVLSVSDNGPGISGINLKDIWLPGQTTNPNGTGLGLTIVRDAVFDMSGKVRAEPKSEFGGAKIIVELPILGS